MVKVCLIIIQCHSPCLFICTVCLMMCLRKNWLDFNDIKLYDGQIELYDHQSCGSILFKILNLNCLWEKSAFLPAPKTHRIYFPYWSKRKATTKEKLTSYPFSLSRMKYNWNCTWIASCLTPSRVFKGIHHGHLWQCLVSLRTYLHPSDQSFAVDAQSHHQWPQ